MTDYDYYQSLERIVKAISLKMDEGDFNKVIDTIDWIDQSLSRFFDLHQSRKEDFFRIFDPNYFFEAPDQKQPEFDKINLSELLNSGDNSSSSVKKSILVSNLSDYKINIRERSLNRDGKSFLERLLLLFYSIWEKSRKIRGYSIDISIGQLYHNLMLSISDLNDEIVNTPKILKYFFETQEKQLYDLAKGVTDIEFLWRSDLANSIDLIFKEAFPIKYAHIVQDHIFNQLRYTFSDDLILQKRYVEWITDSHRTLDYDGFEELNFELRSYLIDELSREGIDNSEFEVKETEVKEMVKMNLREAKTFIEVEAKNKDLLDFFNKEWVKPIMHSKNLERLNAGIIKNVQLYKARLERNTLYSLILYALGQDKYSFVDYVFENNTPHKLNSGWTKPKQAPITLDQTFEIVQNHRLRELVFVSEKYDIEHLIDLFIIFSLKFVLRYETRFYVRNEQVLKTYFLNRDWEELQSFRLRFESVSKMINNSQAEYLNNFHSEEIEEIKKITDEVREIIKNKERDNTVQSEIPKESLQKLLFDIERDVHKHSFFLKLIGHFSLIIKSVNEQDYNENRHIGVYLNEVRLRKSHLPDNPVKTYGIVESFSKRLVKSLDLLILRKFRSAIESNVDHSFINCQNRQAFLNGFKSIPARIAVFRNVLPSRLLNEVDGFIPNFKSESNEFDTFGYAFQGFFQDTALFFFNDPFKDNKEVFVLNPENVGLLSRIVTKESREVNYGMNQLIQARIIDLPKDSDAKSKIESESPSWLEREKEETGFSADEILNEKIWFRVFGYIEYIPSKNIVFIPSREIRKTGTFKIDF